MNKSALPKVFKVYSKVGTDPRNRIPYHERHNPRLTDDLMMTYESVMTEADTCREFVTPKLVEAGWNHAPHAIGAALLKEFRLYTIVRLPLSEGSKKYSKTAPLQFDEFAPVLAWWGSREENAQAWQVSAADIVESGYNLDRKNPNAKAGLEHADPAELVASMRGHEAEIMRLLGEIETLVGEARA